MLVTLILIFIFGYVAIAFEHPIKINKSATAILTGVLMWTIYILLDHNTTEINHHLIQHLAEISQILFFLLAAMTIVELMDAHDSFQIITDKIKTTDKRKLIWIVAILTFFLSAILDNLTTTIVIISLLRRLVQDRKDRLYCVGITVIAANAGGAWSPIGDVTTTMLWINNQITTYNIMTGLFFPSIIGLIVPLIVISIKLKGKLSPTTIESKTGNTTQWERNIVFAIGLGALIFVPIYKTVTHLPPYMGILFGLGLMWVVTELIHSAKDDADKDSLSVLHALRKIDTASILFFLGILLSIACLESTRLLSTMALWLDKSIGNHSIIIILIGLLSSIIDNVPLVAAAQGMYSLEQFPTDHYFWIFLAYTAGTGGSCLIIGSAAGVAAMGMEKIDFIWFLKKISVYAFLGFFAGCIAYMMQYYIIHGQLG